MQKLQMLGSVSRIFKLSPALLNASRLISTTSVQAHHCPRPLGPKDKVPDFKGTAVVDGEFKPIKLKDYEGKWLVFFFYPLDFTFVCPTEIIAFSDRVEEFKKLGVQVVACSCDSHFSHLAWTQTPRRESGLSYRGLFIADPKGNIRSVTCNDLPVGRSVDETLRVIKAFQHVEKHGEVCPADWKEDSPTIKPSDSKEYFEKVNKVLMNQRGLAPFGTEYDELDESEKDHVFKKPATVYDQVATDEKGRRRFHGAFTGGFSAGFFNTVGSKKGFYPQAFKSTRDERQDRFKQKPEDFMDSEDLGEFGISSRQIKRSENFQKEDSNRKRLAWEHDGGAVSGLAGLVEDMIRPSSDTIGITMLREMGWRQGRGVGLLTAREKAQRGTDEWDRNEIDRWAGGFELSADDCFVKIMKPVEGVHGIGYKGLQSTSVLDQTSGFRETAYKGASKGRGIKGQAFGVGAFEDEDDNIYTSFDLSQYDFALDVPGKAPQAAHVDTHFTPPVGRVPPRKFYPPPQLPPNFKPEHKPFALDQSKLPNQVQESIQRMNPEIRARILGEERTKNFEAMKKEDRARARGTRVSRWHEPPAPDDGIIPFCWRPVFLDEPMKYARFKEFLLYTKRGLPYPKPTDMSVWEWEAEKKDFEAQLSEKEREMLPEVRSRTQPLANTSLTMPLQEILQSRFVSEKGPAEKLAGIDKDKMAAVQMDLFGTKTRTTHEWRPNKNLAKAFNVPNAFPGSTFDGCWHMQKSTKPKDSIANLGLPNTHDELAFKEQKWHGEPLPHDKDDIKEEVQGEIEEPKLDAVWTERPPMELFEAIFDESEKIDEEEERQIAEAQRRRTEEKERRARLHAKKYHLLAKNVKIPGVAPVSSDESDEERAVKPTVAVDEPTTAIGPALPPAASSSSVITADTLLKYLKEDLGGSHSSRKPKHKKKKAKKEKKSKAAKRKRSKTSKKHSESDSGASTVTLDSD
ncbi:unnamed protein product, partial [Mesorhabditis spiculigera]